MTRNWKQVGWNGIRFKAPAEWETAQIGTRHLILEDERGPAMEVKWGSVKGAFSHKSHLKQITAQQSKRAGVRVSGWFLPPRWKEALAEYDTSGFLWQSRDTSGRGAILFCPVCRNAALIQFFHDSSAEREKVLLAVLKSFRDHGGTDRVIWSIFDIRATLPKKMHLLHFRFEAGKYELAFTAGRQNIHLHRWAPAAALLGGQDLIPFIRGIPEFFKGQPTPSIFNGCQAVEWRVSPASGWRQKISPFKVNPSFFWFRLWHLEAQNRILGVRAESKRPLDFELLNQICKDYESI